MRKALLEEIGGARNEDPSKKADVSRSRIPAIYVTHSITLQFTS